MNQNQIEIYFSYSGFTPLYKSKLGNNKLFFFNHDFSIGNLQNINTEVDINPENNIRIWSSKINVQEYLNFLYICYKFKGKNISVIFTDDYSKYVYSLGATTYNEIPNMLKYERKLTPEQIEEFKNEWIRIVKENSEIRILKQNTIICTNYEYFNNYLKKHYHNNINKWIGNLMANDETNNYSSDVYKFLINNLNNK